MPHGKFTLSSVGSTIELGAGAFREHLAHSSFAEQSHTTSFSDMNDQDLRSFLNPKPEDYFIMPMRALSATPEIRDYRIDFSHDGGSALKNAVPMFNDLTVFKNHEQDVDKWVGKTEQAWWDDARGEQPGGVNFMVKIDSKVDPRLARGMASGMVTSGSVTIEFDYDKSHPKMDDSEFYMNMGDIVKGERVRALVTGITRLYEYSVVWQGADSRAKGLNPDGTINVPGTQSNSLSLEESMSLKLLATALGLANPETATDEQVTASFNQKIAEQNLSATKLATVTTEKATVETQLTQKTTELASANTKVTELTTKVVELEPKAAIGTTALTNERAEAIRLYNVVEADKATDVIRKTINEGSFEVAKSFIDSYKVRAEALAPQKCQKCGSTELSRRSSTGGTEDHKETSTATLEQARTNVALKSIHG